MASLIVRSALAAEIISFDNSSDEVGVTFPGATDFSLVGSTWTGGTVANQSFPSLNASGQFSYEIASSGGEVIFDNPVDAATFFFVHSEPTVSPSPRGGAPAVWLADQRKMVLFGGMAPITPDTWAYDANSRSWQQLNPENQGAVPGARCCGTFVSDPQNENNILFGGFSFTGRFNDVWRFEEETESWQELTITGTPPQPRCLQTAAHVGSQNEIVVYGGIQRGGVLPGDFFDDTFILDLDQNEWSLVDTAGPGKLRGAISFYSSAEDAVYLWGGRQVSSFPSTLWRFDVEERSWESISTDGDIPVGREDPAFFWDDTNQQLHLFSGHNDADNVDPLLNDAYKLDLATGTWQELSVEGAPDPRWRSSVAFDPDTGTGILFGGWNDFGGQDAFNDVWLYDAATSTWSPGLAPLLSPGVATAFDALGNTIGSVSSHAASTSGDPTNFVTLDPSEPIARIEFTGSAIDSFSFQLIPLTDLPCDFNGDGLCDVVDIDTLDEAIIAGINNADFDLTGDGLVNIIDQDQWRSDAAIENGFTEPYLVGDANLDGSVLADDLNIVETNWLTSSNLWGSGDFNADGLVNGLDLNALNLNWQKSISTVAVPEPSTALLMVIGLAGLVMRQCRHTNSGRLL